MVTSGWLVVPHPEKGVWRFVKMRPGELCVMMPGNLLTLLWLADSWDSLEQVSSLMSLPVDPVAT